MSALVLIPQHFGSLLFDRGSSRYYPFDQEATSFLRRLITTPDDVVVSQSEDPETAVAFLQQIGPLSFLRPDGRLAATVLNAVPPEDHLLGPLAVHVEVIAKCNLACTHCFADPLPRGGRDALTCAELDDLFGQLAALGSFRLGLTGGEPLLRKDILEIIDAALGHGLHPCITTNGFFLTDQVARALGKRDMVWINVSLDGATAARNDAIRGAGSFDTVISRLKHLRDHARFTLAFTITKDNVDEVEDCVALAEEVGAQTAVFRPIYPTGAALKRPELMPEFSAYQRALAKIEALADRRSSGPSPGRLLEPFSPRARQTKTGRVFVGSGCGAANTVCSVAIDGQVNPCSFLGERFESGSIRARPFKELWDEGASFLKLRNASGEAFSTGCRARSLAASGSVHARDPWEREWTEGPAPSRVLEVLVD